MSLNEWWATIPDGLWNCSTKEIFSWVDNETDKLLKRIRILDWCPNQADWDYAFQVICNIAEERFDAFLNYYLEEVHGRKYQEAVAVQNALVMWGVQGRGGMLTNDPVDLITTFLPSDPEHL